MNVSIVQQTFKKKEQVSCSLPLWRQRIQTERPVGHKAENYKPAHRYPDYLDKIKPNQPMDLSSVMSNLDANRRGRDRHCDSPCEDSLWAQTGTTILASLSTT